MKIAVISTSPRKNSNSLRFARHIRNVLETYGQQEIGLANFEAYDIPLVGQGEVDPDNLTAFQQELTDTWAAADLVFFVVPEYNWITSPQFINMLHQLGDTPFKHLFDNKVFAFAGVSNGRGGRQPAIQMTTILNKLINFLDGYSVVSARIYESHETQKNIDESGHSLGNETYDRTAKAFIDYSLKIGQRWTV